MGTKSKKEYLEAIRSRYSRSDKKTKTIILNEFCATCGYNRKYAIRLLNSIEPIVEVKRKKKPGRPRKYHRPEILTVLKQLWTLLNLPCSKRLSEGSSYVNSQGFLSRQSLYWLPPYG